MQILQHSISSRFDTASLSNQIVMRSRHRLSADRQLIYRFNTTTASGGKFNSNDCGWPWHAIGSEWHAAEVAFIGAAVNRGIAVQHLAPVARQTAHLRDIPDAVRA